jgi:hypothetical protein
MVDYISPERLEATERIVALFELPTIYNLAGLVPAEADLSGKGRHCPYPPLALLLVFFAGRAAGSQCSADRLLRKGLWAQCAEAYTEHTGVRLPAFPPSIAQVTHSIRRLAFDKTRTEQVFEMLTRSSVALAQLLGNLRPGQQRRWNEVDWDHLVVGDGVNIKAYSKARIDTVDGEKVLTGSRARSIDTARVQRTFTNYKDDDKVGAVGINNVMAQTWTAYGAVILAADLALGSEAKAFDILIDRILAHANGGVHSVAWDGAATGWRNEHLMAVHQVMLLVKGVARSKKNLGSKNSRIRIRHLTDEEAIERHINGDRMPLGTSVYPSAKSTSGYEVIRGSYRKVTTVECAHGNHELWVDDRALCEVQYEPGQPYYKVADAQMLTAEPVTGNDGYTDVISTWRVPCEHGDHTHPLTWDPDPAKARSKDTKNFRRAMSLLCLPGRNDPRFRDMFGRRSTAESTNNWYQATLASWREGAATAAHLAPEVQKLDLLAAAYLRNALTYHQFCLSQS